MTDPVALLREIAAAPRPAGSAAESAARRRCAAELEAMGFATFKREFHYSAFPGVYGAPLVGGLLAAAGGVAVRDARRGRARRGAARATALAALGGAAGAWMLRYGTTRLPVMRRRGVNLEARRGERPRIWLVAHLDTKSQRVSLASRAAGAVGSAAAWAAMVGEAARPHERANTVVALGAAEIAAALPLLGGRAGADSAGALDDASGVATVLAAAAQIPVEIPLGVLLTSGEELALAGARAWLRGAGRRFGRGVAINCDGVDDTGAVACIVASDPGRILATAVAQLRPGRAPVRLRRRLPGVLFDAVAFADAGWSAMTVSRGHLRSLARVHTPSDDLTRLRGAGIPDVAAIIAMLVTALARPERRPDSSPAR